MASILDSKAEFKKRATELVGQADADKFATQHIDTFGGEGGRSAKGRVPHKSGSLQLCGDIAAKERFGDQGKWTNAFKVQVPLTANCRPTTTSAAKPKARIKPRTSKHRLGEVGCGGAGREAPCPPFPQGGFCR